jgi:hypothetical protein
MEKRTHRFVHLMNITEPTIIKMPTQRITVAGPAESLVIGHGSGKVVGPNAHIRRTNASNNNM